VASDKEKQKPAVTVRGEFEVSNRVVDDPVAASRKHIVIKSVIAARDALFYVAIAKRKERLRALAEENETLDRAKGLLGRTESEKWGSKAAFAAVATVATAGITGMVAVIGLNYAGWPDVMDNVLRGFNVHIPHLESVPFWESIVYLVIFGLVVFLIVREILGTIRRP
jgi:hypothetical protein